jgi:hypothetical protein
MTATMSTDGRTRKSLAKQIDRLDAILDGLGDALNESVATAVSQAVGRAIKEAVQAVLSQALTDPALRERALAAENPPAPRADSPSVPRPLARLATWLGVLGLVAGDGWPAKQTSRVPYFGRACRGGNRLLLVRSYGPPGRKRRGPRPGPGAAENQRPCLMPATGPPRNGRHSDREAAPAPGRGRGSQVAG